MKNQSSRKRPLVSSRAGSSGLVPKTGTTLELEAILDGKVKKKKKKQQMKATSTAPHNHKKAKQQKQPQASSIGAMSHFSRSSLLSLSASQSQSSAVVRDSLAPRGGLAAAPSFRVKPLVVTNNNNRNNLSTKKSKAMKKRKTTEMQTSQSPSIRKISTSGVPETSTDESSDKKFLRVTNKNKPARVSLDPSDAADGNIHSSLRLSNREPSSVTKNQTDDFKPKASGNPYLNLSTTSSSVQRERKNADPRIQSMKTNENQKPSSFGKVVTTQSLLDGARSTNQLLTTEKQTASLKKPSRTIMSQQRPAPPPYQRQSSLLSLDTTTDKTETHERPSSSLNATASQYVASAPKETNADDFTTVEFPEPASADTQQGIIERKAVAPQPPRTSLRIGGGPSNKKKRLARRSESSSSSSSSNRHPQMQMPTVRMDGETPVQHDFSAHDAPVMMEIPMVAMETVLAKKKPSSSSSSTTQIAVDDMKEPSKESSKKTKAKPVDNDNFVRLNLRNSAGACRGARNKKFKKKNNSSNSRWGNKYNDRNKMEANSDDDDDNNRDTQGRTSSRSMGSTSAVPLSRMSGLDPIDDYLDGVFHGSHYSSATTSKGKSALAKAKATSSSSATTATTIPKCARHDRPCKQLVVKKASTGNKGRKFFVCSMPRGEQCDHFQWADDTVEVSFPHVLLPRYRFSMTRIYSCFHIQRCLFIMILLMLS